MLNLNAYFVPVKRNRIFLKIQIGQKKGEGQKTGQCTDIMYLSNLKNCMSNWSNHKKAFLQLFDIFYYSLIYDICSDRTIFTLEQIYFTL